MLIDLHDDVRLWIRCLKHCMCSECGRVVPMGFGPIERLDVIQSGLGTGIMAVTQTDTLLSSGLMLFLSVVLLSGSRFSKWIEFPRALFFRADYQLPGQSAKIR
jgi:hypothetical protein